MKTPARKPPAKRLYSLGLGGVPKIDPELQKAIDKVKKENPDDRGRRMTGAPHRKGGEGVISSVADVAAVANAQERNERTLGPANGRDPAVFDFVGGRRVVKPEGTGDTPDVVLGSGGTIQERPTKKFKVKLDAHQYDQLLSQLAGEIFEDLGPSFCCRLCKRETNWLRDCKAHIADEHGVVVRSRAETSVRKERELAREARRKAKLDRERQQIAHRQQSWREGWTKPKIVSKQKP